jgi:exosortase/archaeosortase family protein
LAAVPLVVLAADSLRLGILAQLNENVCAHLRQRIVAGHLILRSSWSRASFALLTIPIVIFKNAVRIVTISWLGVYVDSGFLYGRLHRYSGLPFSLLALALLAPVLLLLVKTEQRGKTIA